MKVDIRKRRKVKAEEILIKECFKPVGKDDCYIRVDLSKEEAFKDVLREDVVYAVHFSTGELVIFEQALIVEGVNLRAVEVKEDKDERGEGE